jgi:hypothetical protein
MNNLKQLITDNDTWSAGEGENEGTPFILRYRPHLQDFIATKKFNKHLTITWQYESDDDLLLPTDEDIDLMQEVENALVDTFETDLQCVLAFVYIGQNQKEWHWYSSDIKETGLRLNKALDNFDELPLDLSSEDDPDWEEYKAVLEGAVGAEEEE